MICTGRYGLGYTLTLDKTLFLRKAGTNLISYSINLHRRFVQFASSETLSVIPYFLPEINHPERQTTLDGTDLTNSLMGYPQVTAEVTLSMDSPLYELETLLFVMWYSSLEQNRISSILRVHKWRISKHL